MADWDRKCKHVMRPKSGCYSSIQLDAMRKDIKILDMKGDKGKVKGNIPVP